MTTTIYETFVQMWVIDFEIGIFGKSYFQNLVQNGQLKAEDYQKIVGEDYVAGNKTTVANSQA